MLSCGLRFAVECLYELCPGFSMPDETVETRHPWLDFSLPRRPCLGISVLYSIILQTLNSCAIRPPYSTACLHHRLTPLTLRYNVLVLTCGSDGMALSACTWEAQNLRRFPLNTLNSPESMQCVLKEIMNCHEVPYSLITKKAPAYPQSIRTWARGCLHNFLKNILHATPASSQPLCGKLKTSTASHSHHRPAKLRQRILLHS